MRTYGDVEEDGGGLPSPVDHALLVLVDVCQFVYSSDVMKGRQGMCHTAMQNSLVHD